MSFKIGDVVQLNSGGPKMTVDGFDLTEVICVWFQGTSKQSGKFQAASLKVYEAPKAHPPVSVPRAGGSHWAG